MNTNSILLVRFADPESFTNPGFLGFEKSKPGFWVWVLLTIVDHLSCAAFMILNGTVFPHVPYTILLNSRSIKISHIIGSRALSFSDPYFHFTCLCVLLSFCLSVRNFRAKYLGNEAR